MKDRIKWIDVMKFFGIFAIYLGHFGIQAGRAADFVFTHHVALFFLISGCVENLNTEDNIVKYAVKKVKTILVPCFFFAYVTVALDVIQGGYGWDYVKGMSLIIARGLIRNTFGNPTLWYLTCLFSIQMIFFVIKKIKYKPLIFMVCLGLYYIAIEVLPVNPVYSPSWFFNVDSALFYILYYAIGYLVYPYVLQLFELDTMKKKVFFCISGGLSLVYTIGMYLGVDIFSKIKFPSEALLFVPILVTCIIIWSYFVVARLFQDAKIFVEIGKNTLYLCGNEYIVKCLIGNFASLLGIPLLVLNPLQTHLYVGFLLIAANKYLVPMEKYILKKIVR